MCTLLHVNSISIKMLNIKKRKQQKLINDSRKIQTLVLTSLNEENEKVSLSTGENIFYDVDLKKHLFSEYMKNSYSVG